MKFNKLIPGSQHIQHQDWHIVHAPSLSLRWLGELLEFNLPINKDDDERVISLETSSLILKLDSDIGPIAAKYYREKNVETIMRNTFLNTRAQHCWGYAHFLLNQGLNTPEPLAFIEERKMGLRWRSWYISRFDESTTCDEYYLNAKSITPAMSNNATAIVDLFIQMRKCQLSHGDFKATNILMTDDLPSLIDLDSMKYHTNKNSAERMWRQDIHRFMDNWRERYDIYKKFKQAFLKRGIEVS